MSEKRFLRHMRENRQKDRTFAIPCRQTGHRGCRLTVIPSRIQTIQTYMQEQFSRTRLLFGQPAMDRLAASRVAVFGVGGVGGYVVEVLARSGVGHIDVIDNDRVSLSNINRQIIALHSTVGQRKVDVIEQRILDINPSCTVEKHAMFYLPQNAGDIDLRQYDYVVDCIDTVVSKIHLISECDRLQIPLISCMGAANKTDPTAFRIADLWETKMDPLAKVLRKKLRKMGSPHVKVVYSEEVPLEPVEEETHEEDIHRQANPEMITTNTKRRTPASNAFVPAAAGLVIGGEVVKDLIADRRPSDSDPQQPSCH